MKAYDILLIIYVIFHLTYGVCRARNILADDTDEKILLTDIKEIILYRRQYTKARRLPPVLQMNCIAGSAKCAYTPDFIDCFNKGSGGSGIEVKILFCC